MFALASAFAPRNSFKSSSMLSNLYQDVGYQTGVSTASPHQLVTMLYDGVLESIAKARGAIASGDIDTKGRAIGRANRIMEEGLRAALDPAGGEITANLSSLYNYIIRRLLQAHLRNDVEALDECRRLIEPVREAWVAIGAKVGA